jgi:hypothetical protein
LVPPQDAIVDAVFRALEEKARKDREMERKVQEKAAEAKHLIEVKRDRRCFPFCVLFVVFIGIAILLNILQAAHVL